MLKKEKLLHGIVGFIILSAFFSPMPSWAQSEDLIHFDTDRQRWLVDTDGDGSPDLTEELAGTDVLDALSVPGPESSLFEDGEEGLGNISEGLGFPRSSCRSGFRRFTRLCIDRSLRNPEHFQNAAWTCRRNRARVCTSEDIYWVQWKTSSLNNQYNSNGKWLGIFAADDRVFCGNRNLTFRGDPDVFNFEGTCDKLDRRGFWCCHDRE